MDTIMQKLWTPEEIEVVKKMAAEGKTASQIGLEVGRSRNSVIGAVHRNKVQLLARREHPPSEPKENKPRARHGDHLRRPFITAPTPKGSKYDTPPPPPPDTTSYVKFLDRRSSQCAFIVEKRKNTYICCGATATRGSWCEYHASIVYRPPDQQPRFRDGGDGKHKKIHGPSR